MILLELIFLITRKYRTMNYPLYQLINSIIWIIISMVLMICNNSLRHDKKALKKENEKLKEIEQIKLEEDTPPSEILRNTLNKLKCYGAVDSDTNNEQKDK